MLGASPIRDRVGVAGGGSMTEGIAGVAGLLAAREEALRRDRWYLPPSCYVAKSIVHVCADMDCPDDAVYEVSASIRITWRRPEYSCAGNICRREWKSNDRIDGSGGGVRQSGRHRRRARPLQRKQLGGRSSVRSGLLVRAVNVALTGLPHDPLSDIDGLRAEVLRLYRLAIGQGRWVVSWNDYPGRTADEVVSAFRLAAVKARAAA